MMYRSFASHLFPSSFPSPLPLFPFPPSTLSLPFPLLPILPLLSLLPLIRALGFRDHVLDFLMPVT